MMVVWVRDKARQRRQSAGQAEAEAGRARTQREGSRWFMYDILRGGGELTRRCKSSGIDCCTINAVRLCRVH